MRAPGSLPFDFVARLSRKDPSLWSDDPTEQAEIAQRLGWIDAPARMRERLPEIEALVAGVRADGFDRVLVLGMGGSSLAAEVFGEVYRGTRDGLDVRVCDSTVPSAVRAATQWADLGHTLFIVSSKSGTTAEVDALYRHFRSRHPEGGARRSASRREDARARRQAQGRTCGGAAAGPCRGEGSASDLPPPPDDESQRFVAITDPGTPLERLAAEQRFRACVLGFPDVGGRYSALTPFGLVPAALAGASMSLVMGLLAIADTAVVMAAVEEILEGLGDSIGDAARSICSSQTASIPGARVNHLMWLERYQSSPVMDPWTEQLVAESTGKNGRGILPVVRAVGSRPRSAIGSSAPGPVMMRQMVECAAVCATLGVNPFDQPDVDGAKQRTREQLARVEAGQSLAAPPAADARAVRGLLDRLRETDEYVALLAFVRRTDAMDAALNSIALLLQARGVAVPIGYGPRYLHSTGQFHKGGPDCGVFVVITAHDDELPIPGRSYGFQTLCLAQAYGDIHALRDRGRRVVHWDCGADVAAGLAELREAVSPPLV